MAHKFRKNEPANTAQNFATALRSGSIAQQKAALQKLRLIIRAQTWHPRLQGLQGDALTEKVNDIAQEYCEHLLQNPTKLAAHQVKGWGAIQMDTRRFLDRSDKIEHGNEYGPMRRLLYNKIRAILRENPHTFSRTHNRWFLIEFPPTGPLNTSAIHPPETLDDLKSRLPALPATYHGRDDRTPPIVQSETLKPYLIHILKTATRALTAGELHDLCWDKLRPAPLYTQFDEAENSLDNHHDPTSTTPTHILHIQRPRLTEQAHAFHKNLSPRAQKSAILHLRTNPQLSYRDIANKLGCSHGTIENDYKHFRELLATHIHRHDLTPAESGLFLEILLDTLEAAAFPAVETAADAGDSQ